MVDRLLDIFSPELPAHVIFTFFFFFGGGGEGGGGGAVESFCFQEGNLATLFNFTEPGSMVLSISALFILHAT